LPDERRHAPRATPDTLPPGHSILTHTTTPWVCLHTGHTHTATHTTHTGDSYSPSHGALHCLHSCAHAPPPRHRTPRALARLPLHTRPCLYTPHCRARLPLALYTYLHTACHARCARLRTACLHAATHAHTAPAAPLRTVAVPRTRAHRRYTCRHAPYALPGRVTFRTCRATLPAGTRYRTTSAACLPLPAPLPRCLPPHRMRTVHYLHCLARAFHCTRTGHTAATCTLPAHHTAWDTLQHCLSHAPPACRRPLPHLLTTPLPLWQPLPPVISPPPVGGHTPHHCWPPLRQQLHGCYMAAFCTYTPLLLPPSTFLLPPICLLSFTALHHPHTLHALHPTHTHHAHTPALPHLRTHTLCHTHLHTHAHTHTLPHTCHTHTHTTAHTLCHGTYTPHTPHYIPHNTCTPHQVGTLPLYTLLGLPATTTARDHHCGSAACLS